METNDIIHLRITDDSKRQALLAVLSALDFVVIEPDDAPPHNLPTSQIDSDAPLMSLYGMMPDLTLNELRDKAWKRTV